MANSKKKRTRQDPALLFYTSDFLVRTIDLTYDQRGKLITLMCLQHQNGHLEESTLNSICGGEDETIFSRFCVDDQGKFFIEEIENEVQRRAEISDTKSNAANTRWTRWKVLKSEEQKQLPASMQGNSDSPQKVLVDLHIPEYDD